MPAISGFQDYSGNWCCDDLYRFIRVRFSHAEALTEFQEIVYPASRAWHLVALVFIFIRRKHHRPSTSEALCSYTATAMNDYPPYFLFPFP